MATGWNLQLAKQAGEYLVAAELCRRDLITTTFTGNVPHYDIIASRPNGSHVSIQVKTIRSGSWQFDVGKFAQVTFKGRRQVMGKWLSEPLPGSFCVLVILGDTGKDRFFVLKWRDLQRIIVSGHRRWLKRIGGVRPRNPKSLHSALAPSRLSHYENDWALIEKSVVSNMRSARRRTSRDR